MRVRILSGNEAGCEREVGQTEGESMCQFGFAALVVAPPAKLRRAAPPVSTAPTVAPSVPPDRPETLAERIQRLQAGGLVDARPHE